MPESNVPAYSYVIGGHKNYYVRHTGVQIEKLIGTNSFEVYTILGHFSLLSTYTCEVVSKKIDISNDEQLAIIFHGLCIICTFYTG